MEGLGKKSYDDNRYYIQDYEWSRLIQESATCQTQIRSFAARINWLGGVKTGLCLHIQQITCKVKKKAKMKLYKYLIRQHAMEARDGMVVRLHVFLACVHDGGESSSFTPRSLFHLLRTGWSGWTPDHVWTLWKTKTFAPDKNHPPYSIFAKLIELTQVPLSDIEDTRHRWEKQILKESNSYFTREHTISLFVFIVHAIYLIRKYPCFKVKCIKYSEPLATSLV